MNTSSNNRLVRLFIAESSTLVLTLFLGMFWGFLFPQLRGVQIQAYPWANQTHLWLVIAGLVFLESLAFYVWNHSLMVLRENNQQIYTFPYKSLIWSIGLVSVFCAGWVLSVKPFLSQESKVLRHDVSSFQTLNDFLDKASCDEGLTKLSELQKQLDPTHPNQFSDISLVLQQTSWVKMYSKGCMDGKTLAFHVQELQNTARILNTTLAPYAGNPLTWTGVLSSKRMPNYLYSKIPFSANIWCTIQKNDPEACMQVQGQVNLAVVAKAPKLPLKQDMP